MGSFFANIYKAIGRHSLPALVFVAGLAASGWAYVARFEHAEAQRMDQLRDAAEDYVFLLRHRLDLYAGASRDLGAFFSASNQIEAEEFAAFVNASRVFDRLDGVRALGYLPRVPSREAERFEAAASRQFPGYRITERRPGAEDYYPLLYGQHASDPARIDTLRGLDYAAAPERRTAMEEAAWRDAPTATRRMAAVRDPEQRQVILIFSPVRTPRASATPAQPEGSLRGFIFSALYLDRLFLGFDNGRMAREFDLEVYDGAVTSENVVFDADGTPHALHAKPRRLLAHSAEVQFANRRWLIYFYAKPAGVDIGSVHAAALVALLGVLLSTIASYAVAAWPRYRARKRAMHDFSERFAGFFENHPFAVYAMDAQRRFLHVNQQMAKELGVPAETLVGTEIDQYVSNEDRGEVARKFGEALRGQAVAYTTRVTDHAGRRSDMSIVLIPMSIGDRVTHVLGFAENITERKEAERALYASRQMLQLILDNIPQSVFWKNLDSVYEGGNRALLADAGLASDTELIGRTDFDLRWKGQAEHYRQVDLEVMSSGVPRMRMQGLDVRPDGTECWIETNKIPLKDDTGRVVGVLAVTEDITARKYMEQELFRRANHDPLTGLPNRGYFNSHLEQAVARAQRGGPMALMYFDIDRFKQINDTYGHDVGDDVIRMFASRVRAVVREADFLARLGGDEFVLVAEGLSGTGDGAVIAGKILAAMVPPFQLGMAALRVTTSIGVACVAPGMKPETLIKAADQAMYDAKRAGRGCFREATSPAVQPVE
ncbi:PAS domain S-box-containing protein/diguanylate cyclase (GGDEF)-like protein [Pseudoduganella flava]|uniref:Diguanylate cyclase n=1 Tax=Pseudoduganella flava TaxID=871742 RepID=A0A562PL99_9BURK|nr:diguanylate cyclase [Pseudoduganella flava]QGZ41048.1 diguanylate cyclase [Pseudoduganella flava]TWI45252.1 PAS domain S-box-containing protein/diguanylate cyclase (GGDEF)-like protein [Pseudoduganella flava]